MLLLEADLLADDHAWEGVERALLKVLAVRPGHQEARERLMEPRRSAPPGRTGNASQWRAG